MERLDRRLGEANDPPYWEMGNQRESGLPHGSFADDGTPEWVNVALCIIVGMALALAACWIGNYLT